MATIEKSGVATNMFERHHELIFKDGKLFQLETNGFGESRLVDITEEVAKIITDYIRH